MMKCQVKKYSGLKSLSARRAWIEISLNYKEVLYMGGRSPQGERG